MNTNLPLAGKANQYLRILPALLIASSLLISGCNGTATVKTETTLEDAAPKRLAVADSVLPLTAAQHKNLEVVVPKQVPFTKQVHANGRVEVPPEGFASVSLPFPGTIRNLHLLQGSPVRKGQVLCQVEDPGVIDLQQQYLEARAQLAFLEKEAARQQQLADESIGAAKAAEKATSELEIFRSRVAGLAAKIRLLHVDPERLSPETLVSSYPLISPISGIVTTLHTATGKKLLTGEAALELISTAHLHAEIYVYETDVPFVKAGQPVVLRLAQELSQSYMGTIHLLNNSLETNRTLRVHVHFAREKPSWVVGSYLNASIQVQQRAWEVPATALQRVGDQVFVWRVEPSQLVRTPVRVLETSEDWVRVAWQTPVPDTLVVAALSDALPTLYASNYTEQLE